MNAAPDFIKGTFVWRLVLPDGPDALERSEREIAAVQNLLDRSVRSCVITSGLVGLDDAVPNWDGSWPYILRPTSRVDHDWNRIAAFMLRSRDAHDAWISFHLNITDVNVGLREHAETQAFFERLRDAGAIYTRPGDRHGVPRSGAATVPDRIPAEMATMDYVQPGDPTDIFAIVDYRRFWESGIAAEMIDAFFDRLPYAPPILYCDVLTTTGSNLTAGLPDGLLGGSEISQREGRARILEHIAARGSEPGGESPSWWTRYNWNHGGMSLNDYSRIETGFGQGACSHRGAEWQHVDGNQGAYSLDVEGTLIARDLGFAQGAAGVVAAGAAVPASNAPSETAEWRTREQVVEGFYLTTIQELFHIGAGNVRMPGGPDIERIDAHEGRVELDEFRLHDADGGLLAVGHAADGELGGAVGTRIHPSATGGALVTGMDTGIASACTVLLEAPVDSPRDGVLVVRYLSPQGGACRLETPDGAVDVTFPPTTNDSILADLAVPVRVRPGVNRFTLRKGAIRAAWSDGTEARWDADGFRAGNGDVDFGIGYDRFWPDTWSGDRRIHLYSRDGMDRAWRLPVDWRHHTELRLHQLSEHGRDEGEIVPVIGGSVQVRLPPRRPGVLVPVVA